MKKSIKLLALSFLATATISLPLTFLISSCTTSNNTSSISNIVISSQSPSQTNVTTNDAPPTLFVNATTNSGNLKYSWYQSKDDGVTWSLIDGATTASYQIPNTDFNGITSDTTWQYKVEISLENDTATNVTSNVYKVNITPATTTVSFNQDLLKKVALTSDEDISFSISATSDSYKNLWYDWYLQKADGGFTKVQHSTSSTYSINSSEYSGITSTTTWKVYAEVYPEGEVSSKRTSVTCSVEISPYVATKVTPNEAIPPNTIIQPRENTIITNSLTGDGYTTVKYDTEKWIGKNEVSVLTTSKPNLTYLKKYVSDYLTKFQGDAESSNIPDKYGYSLMNYLNTSLQNNTYTLNVSSGGTGWILDYSYDNTNDLVTYYIATNIHVLNATYSIKYDAYVNNMKMSVTATVPINSKTVDSTNIYLSQPQYDETDANKNNIVLANQESNWATDWFKTSITKDNITQNLIPIGAYTDMASPSLGSAYELQLNYREMVDFTINDYKYSFKSDLSRVEPVQSYSTKEASDFAVLKITEPKNKFATYPSNTAKYQTMFKSIQDMFNIDTDKTNVSKTSSYIARLNYLNNMLTTKAYDKAKVDELFMFADYNTDANKIQTTSIAGFPAMYKTENNIDKTYMTFNSNTMSYSLRDKYVGKARQQLEYYYQGYNYFSKYNWPINDMYTGINLLAGSSGSMGISDTYKIIGIYWGGISAEEFRGALTSVYSYTDNKSMVKVWLKYIQSNDTKSELLKLFTGLEAQNYFTS